MTRNLKILAVSLTAFFTLGAAGASAALAASSLEIGANPSIVKGLQFGANPLALTLKKTEAEPVLGTLKCNTDVWEATATAVSVTDLTFEPTFGGCKLGAAAEVHVNGCRYTLKNTTTAKLFNIEITSCTKPLEIIQGTCIVTIGNQGLLAGITMMNLGTTPNEVEATIAVKGIAWSAGSGCAAPLKEVTGTAAEIAGPMRFRAFEDIGGSEGKQVKLEAK